MAIRDMRVLAVLSMVLVGMATAASAQSKPGVVDQLHQIDIAKGVVEPDKYPELTIEQLRSITRYSHLQIKKSKLQVADRKYMRRVEPHAKDKTVLVVHGDHYRFSTLRDGRIDVRKAHKNDRKYYSFLWIKYEGKTAAGASELRDLILYPYQAKSGKLAPEWPFATKYMPMGHVFIARAKMEERQRRGLPEVSDCVVGTFASGKSHYLVLSVPMNYQWWGKVVTHEMLGTRGKDATALDEFHRRPKNKKDPGWASVPKRFPDIQWACKIAARNAKEMQKLTAAVPGLLAMKSKSEDSKGWEDLLELEIEDRPIKAIDDFVLRYKTLGELIGWANDYYQKNSKNGHMHHWAGPLDKIYRENPQSWVVANRVVRYAFRRHGFPARIVAIHQQNRPDFPYYTLRVIIPSRNISWTISGGDHENSIFEHTSAVFESLPHVYSTERGRVSTFDCDLGGETFIIVPVPDWW